MKKFGDLAALFFIFAVVVLSLISILGVWDILSDDVLTKSFQTLGLLAFVSVIVMLFARNASDVNTTSVVSVPNPIFKTIRQVTIVLVIIAVSFLALLGVLAIWDVIANKDVLYKSLSSLAIIAFGSGIIIVTTKERDNK